MTSPLVQVFENVNLHSTYEGLSPHQIWLNLDQGQQSYGGGRRPGEIGLNIIYKFSSSSYLCYPLKLPIFVCATTYQTVYKYSL